MYFNLASGYFTTQLPRSWVGKLTVDLWRDTPHLADARLMHNLVRIKHVSDVVVQDDEVKAWGPVLQAAGLRFIASVGGVTIYHSPGANLPMVRSHRTE